MILTGLLLGGVLAHFFGGPKAQPRSGPTVIGAVPSVAAMPAPIPTATPPPVSPAPTRSAAPTSLPSPTPTVRPTPAIRPTKTPAPVHVAVTAPPTRKPSPKPPSLLPASITPSPAVASAKPSPPATAENRAEAVVRSYLEALARGDRTTAASYLARGLPSETFMNSDSHIESIRSADIGAQQYRVTADVETAGGEYYVTFTLEQGPLGLQITDHYAIKPQ